MSLPARVGRSDPPPAQSFIANCKRLLNEGRERLRENYLAHPSSTHYIRAHARLVDGVLRTVWREQSIPAQVSLVAVGGYGRGVLFPHSDVDVLVLLPDTVDDAVKEQISQLVSRLWDVGLEIGHSVRSIADCMQEAAQDVTVQTALLEARWLAGSRSLYRRFSAMVGSNLDARSFTEAKLLEQRQRHTRFQDSAYSLEPNVKEGPGGLRDLNTISWIAQAGGIGTGWADLASQQVITRPEARQITRLERTLQDFRIRLHLQAGRREDRLAFDLQAPLAQQSGLSDTPTRRASEQLMQRYYRTARAVTQLNEIILTNLRVRLQPQAGSSLLALNERFGIRNELLEAIEENLFERQSAAILESFHLLQQHPQLKGIEASTLRALWRSASRIDGDFRADPAHRALFLSIFKYGSGLTHALRRMNRYDVLGRYLPAFGRIVGQMQHDLFHVYTVDEHILMVVRNLRRFAVTEMAHEYPLCSRLMSEFQRPELLYLAGLFHDIAKGRGGDHSQLGMADARRFCRQHGLDEADTNLVTWLVQRHLFMSTVAQKRDLSDPAVIAEFASEVATERRLTALYLLTVADIRGTSPKVWNAWKGKLLEDLFWTTKRFLGGDTDPTSGRLQGRQRLALETLKLYALPDGVHEKFWAKLDTTYFLRHDAREIAWHTRLLNHRIDTTAAVVKARLSPIGEGVQVMIYISDRKNLFARICGFFERIGFSIVEAKICTTLHDYALDTFQVLDPARATSHYRDIIALIEHDLTEQLNRGDPLPAPIKGRVSRRVRNFPITPEVSLRPDERGSAYYLTFIAGDRPGLLYRVARILVDYGINVLSAKINTLGERAEDSFVITGEALRETRTIIRLESDLIQELHI